MVDVLVREQDRVERACACAGLAEQRLDAPAGRARIHEQAQAAYFDICGVAAGTAAQGGELHGDRNLPSFHC